jgi:predicted RNase H-like HicB family nuclease
MLEYHAAYYQLEEDGGWYYVKLLDFPGVHSQGKTLRSARRMIRDALRLMAEYYLDELRPFPRPNPRVNDKKAVFCEKIPVSVRVPMTLPC